MKKKAEMWHEVSRALVGAGFVMLFNGAATADSDNIAVPIVLLISALVTIGAGMFIERSLERGKGS